MRKPLILLLFLLPISVYAALPEITARVTDLAHMLDADTKTRLEQKLEQLEQTDSTQIVVVTVPSLGGIPLENYSLQLAENAKIGQQGLDNGALLLIAKNEHKIRIEVGYGLEGKLTDLLSGRIIRNIITPEFKKGQFAKGIEEGVDAMIAAVKGEFTAKDLPQKQNFSDDLFSFVVFLFVIFAGFGSILRKHPQIGGVLGAIVCPIASYAIFHVKTMVILLLIPGGFLIGYLASLIFANTFTGTRHRSTTRNNRWRSGGGFGGGGFGGGSFGGGGGFSGGGGGFGGGGASGGW